MASGAALDAAVSTIRALTMPRCLGNAPSARYVIPPEIAGSTPTKTRLTLDPQGISFIYQEQQEEVMLKEPEGLLIFVNLTSLSYKDERADDKAICFYRRLK